MATTIRIEGLEALERKLGRAVADSTINTAIKAAALHVKGKIAEYPDATDANRPKTYQPGRWNTWYERGFGQKWARADGSVGSRATSETLGRKWTIRTSNRSATIGNNVSYGPYVQGATRQTAAMRRIGWKTTKDVAEEESERVLRFVVREIEKALR